MENPGEIRGLELDSRPLDAGPVGEPEHGAGLVEEHRCAVFDARHVAITNRELVHFADLFGVKPGDPALDVPGTALAEDDDSLGGWLLMGGLIIALLALFGILPRSWVSDTGGYWAAW